MKKLSKILIPVLVLATLLISACTGAAAPANSSGGGKNEAAPVEFTGVIEFIDGNQWTVGGQVITVDPSILRDGPFIVGDTVKVEVQVQADGSMVVTRVEAPGANANSNDANSNDVNANDAVLNDVNSNDDNSNDGNSNDVNSNGGLVFDNNGTEAFGTVDTITADSVVIGGQTFAIANGAEFKDQIQAGNFVKVHFLLNADGTMFITEIETWDPALVGDDNSNDSNSNDSNSNDDNGNDDNGNDDSNDDNGNDDNSDDSNSNDDKSNDNGGDSNDD